jgi:hypothetical protein
MHFLIVLLSNQSQFLVVFKFFVQNAFHITTHFHQFHLKLIQHWHASRFVLSGRQICPWLFFQGVPCSLLVMHFITLALSHWLGQTATRNSEHGLRAANWVATMDLREGHTGCENWHRRSQETMRREGHDLSGWRNCIDGAQGSLRKRNEKTRKE